MKVNLMVGVLVGLGLVGSSQQGFALGKAKPLPEPIPTATVVPAPEPTSVPKLPEIRLGDVSAAGSGCLGGYLSAEVSNDQLMVRIRFDHFQAEVQDGGRTMDRKNCSIAIPILQAAENKKLVVAQALLNGANDLATGSTARVSMETFFAGAASQKTESEFLGAAGMFELVQGSGDSLGLSCGSTGVLRLNSSALVQNFGTTRVDEVVVFFNLLPCQGGL